MESWKLKKKKEGESHEILTANFYRFRLTMSSRIPGENHGHPVQVLSAQRGFGGEWGRGGETSRLFVRLGHSVFLRQNRRLSGFPAAFVWKCSHVPEQQTRQQVVSSPDQELSFEGEESQNYLGLTVLMVRYRFCFRILYLNVQYRFENVMSSTFLAF